MTPNHTPGSSNNSTPGRGQDESELRQPPTRRRTQVPLDVVTIMKYLLGADKEIETGILCPDPHVQFVTSDAALYQAIGALKPYDQVPTNRIAKLLEITVVIPQPKWPLTHERVDELRASALKNSIGQLQRKERA